MRWKVYVTRVGGGREMRVWMGWGIGEGVDVIYKVYGAKVGDCMGGEGRAEGWLGGRRDYSPPTDVCPRNIRLVGGTGGGLSGGQGRGVSEPYAVTLRNAP